MEKQHVSHSVFLLLAFGPNSMTTIRTLSWHLKAIVSGSLQLLSLGSGP